MLGEYNLQIFARATPRILANTLPTLPLLPCDIACDVIVSSKRVIHCFISIISALQSHKNIFFAHSQYLMIKASSYLKGST